MSLTTQFYTMLAMIGMGSYFGAALDTYSRFLKPPNRKALIVFVNDILFWLTNALIIFYVLYLVNNGEIRFYIFVALLCGFAAYQSLFKSLYNQILNKTIQILIKLYRFLERTVKSLIFRPVYLFITFIVTVVLTVLNIILKILLFIWNIVFRIIEVFSRPFFLLGKFMWNRLPKSFKIRTSSVFNFINRQISNFFNRFSKKDDE